MCFPFWRITIPGCSFVSAACLPPGIQPAEHSAAETQDPNISRLTIVTEADDQTLEQIIKQVQKLHEIHEVLNLSGDISVKREHVLVRAGCSEETRDGLIQVANLYRAKVLNVAETELMLELTGQPQKD